MYVPIRDGIVVAHLDVPVARVDITGSSWMCGKAMQTHDKNHVRSDFSAPSRQGSLRDTWGDAFVVVAA